VYYNFAAGRFLSKKPCSRLQQLQGLPFMWYKNIAGRFFGLVTEHACDRQTDGRGRTDRITTPKTALA